MKRLAILLPTTLLAFGMVLAPASAQQPPPPHDHNLVVPGTGEQMQFGPPRCSLGETLDRAFLNVHFNVHLGMPTTEGGLIVIADFC